MADTQMRAGSNAVDAKNVVVSQIHAALRLLRKKKVLSDESVHSARKKLKRARAGLRLLPDAVENRRTRAKTPNCVMPLGHLGACATRRPAMEIFEPLKARYLAKRIRRAESIADMPSE